MLVRDLLEIRRKPSSGRGTATHTIELSSENDSVEIDVDFEFTVEAPEYEDGYKSYPGGVDLDDASVQPFTFEKKRYTEITPELVGYIEFPAKFEKANKAKIDRAQDEEKKHPLSKKETDDLVNEYLNFVFDNYVEIDN